MRKSIVRKLEMLKKESVADLSIELKLLKVFFSKATS